VDCVFYMCLFVVRMGSYGFIQCLGSAPVHAASLGTALLRHSFLLFSNVVSEVGCISGESRCGWESNGDGMQD
jgi:hypothetical protein